MIRVGAIEAERNTRAQFGYHIIVPPNEMLRLLAAEKDIVVSPPQPDFWAKHGVIPERHYDFVAAVLEFIEANDGIIPKDDLARLDTAISISETNAKEILWNLSTRTERPLLERSRSGSIVSYDIADHKIARRILKGRHEEYSIVPIPIVKTTVLPQELTETRKVAEIIPFNGAIQFAAVDGSSVDISPEMIDIFIRLAAQTDGHIRRFIRPDIHAHELRQGTRYSEHLVGNAMKLAKRIGIVSDNSDNGYRLTVPLPDLYAMLTGDTDVTLPYPDDALYEDVGLQDYSIRIIDAMSAYLDKNGQFIISDFGLDVARKLGITYTWLQQALNNRLIRGNNSLLKRTDNGVYEVADGQEERMSQIVRAYNTPFEFTVTPVDPSPCIKQATFAPPPPELVIDRVHRKFLEHVEHRGVRRLLRNRQKFAEYFYRLTPDQQEVLWHRLGESLIPAQIGRLMGKSEGAVKAEQHRAVAAIGRHIGIDFHLDRLDDLRIPVRKRPYKKNKSQFVDEFRGENKANLARLIEGIRVRDKMYLGPVAKMDASTFIAIVRALVPRQQHYLYLRFVEGMSQEKLMEHFGWGTTSGDSVMYKRIRDHFIVPTRNKKRAVKRPVSPRKKTNVVVFKQGTA